MTFVYNFIYFNSFSAWYDFLDERRGISQQYVEGRFYRHHSFGIAPVHTVLLYC